MSNCSLKILYFLIISAPYYLFASILIGDAVNAVDAVKALREGLLVTGCLCLLPALYTNFSLIKAKVGGVLIGLVIAYICLQLLLWAIFRPELDAAIIGISQNLRILLIFGMGVILKVLYPQKLTFNFVTKLVIYPSIPIMIFGIMQYFVLPKDFLSHFGWRIENGVKPYFEIDDKDGYLRIMSILRDPNSYGSYLLIIYTWLLIKFRKNNLLDVLKSIRDHKLFVGILLGCCLNILLTFSRSAWLSAIVVTIVVFGQLVFNILKSNIKVSLIVALLLVVFLSGVFWGLQDNDQFQRIVFHADESTVQRDPNELRADLFNQNIELLKDNPFGTGPGTAGLASIHNQQMSILTENYYLQVARESGFVGLIIFLAILYFIFYRIRKISSGEIRTLAMAVFVALIITNFLVHIWANETNAYIWWGMMGILIAQKSNSSKSAA